MKRKTVGELVFDLETNGPVTIHHDGMTFEARLWSTFDRVDPTCPQNETAHDCPCPPCQQATPKETP